MLIDTHSHIYSEEFDEDQCDVIARAEAAGVGCIILPAIDSESYGRQENLANSRPDLFRQMIGLHPTSVKENYKEALGLVQKILFEHPEKYVGVGEIGLDFYWDTSFRKQQLSALKQQICWAEELDKAVSLHLRNGKDCQPENDAYTTLFNLLEHHGSTQYRGILHCFSGTLDNAMQAIKMGFFLGIGGVVTYKKSTMPAIIESVGLEHIVLETDSPYLAPVPYRGHRNESAYMEIVARKIADITNCSLQTVAETTTNNVRCIFKELN